MATDSNSAGAPRRYAPVPPKELPGIGPRLFGELDHHIGRQRLQSDRLPDDFLITEDREGRGNLLFEDRRYDLNITVFQPDTGPRGRCRGSGMFVISNGAGVAANTVDLVARIGPVAGMIDLKRNFTKAKILAALRMVVTARPDVDLVVVNMISGIALVHDAVSAVSEFSRQTGGRIPLVLRFNGADAKRARPVLRSLVEEHENVAHVNSTAELVHTAAAMLGLDAPPVPDPEAAARVVEAALETRASFGVTVDPAKWSTPDRTIEHVFGRKAQTRIGILGFGEVTRYRVGTMEEAGVDIAWAATPTASKHGASGEPRRPKVPVFPTAKEAIAAKGDVGVVINYAPAAHVRAATLGFLEAGSAAQLMMIVAENMAYDHIIDVFDALDAAGMAYLGPNCPGVMILEDGGEHPDLFKIGNMPAHIFERAGGVSLAGRSGTVLFDLVDQATDSGLGIRVAWAIGGDRYTGLGFLDALVLFENDPRTRVIVLNCEAGGIQEQLAAEFIATGVISKPVIAIVTGKTLPAGVQYGHPGSTKITEADDPVVKERRLRNAGCIVVQNATEMVEVVRAIERSGWNLEERRRQVLWDRIRAADRRVGRHWRDRDRPAFDLLHGLAGDWRLHRAHQTSPQHLHELVENLSAFGVDGFRSLLGPFIDPAAFVTAFDKSREYTAELVRAASEVQIERFRRFIEEVLTIEVFNAALRTTPWASADILNEAHQVGLDETVEVLSRTVGLRLFRQTFASKPWNTAHAFRSINNMRRWRFVRAYHRLCTHLVDDAEVVKAAWERNPWATVKLVRGYDRVPDEGLERALEDPETRAVFVRLATTDPQGLLNVGKRAFRTAADIRRPFEEVYRPMLAEGTPERPTIEGEIARMGEADFAALVDTVFTAEAWEQSRSAHPTSAARALQIVNDEGDEETSGARKLVRIFQANADIFDTAAFRIAVTRNLWMTVDLLRAVSRLDPVEVRRIVDYVVTKADFDFSITEHQWGTSQALHKIADMGARLFFEVHQLIEDATQDRASFRMAFKKNPRDTIQIAQVVARIGQRGFTVLMSSPETRAAFLGRMCRSPRIAANFLHQVEVIGAVAFDRLVDEDLGREVLDRMLEHRGPDVVRTIQRIALVGVEAFRKALRAWKAETGRGLTWENALEVVGEIKERVTHEQFSQPHRRVIIRLPGQAMLEVSEAEIEGLYESYPDWADVLLKLKEGKPLPVPEQVDVYELVSGRKRYRDLMVPVLANFVPMRVLRQRLARGERLIPEISRLKGVAQGPGHRFDAYTHALEVLEQLHRTVLPMRFLDGAMRKRVNRVLDERVDHVTRRDLLILATALHDLGKGDGVGGHVERGVEIANQVANRLGLTRAQMALVVDVVRFHRPKKLRRPKEPWDEFVERGGLDLLYEEMMGHGENAHPVESILHYHADILGRKGDKTPAEQVERRVQVTRHLLGRWFAEEKG